MEEAASLVGLEGKAALGRWNLLWTHDDKELERYKLGAGWGEALWTEGIASVNTLPHGEACRSWRSKRERGGHGNLCLLDKSGSPEAIEGFYGRNMISFVSLKGPSGCPLTNGPWGHLRAGQKEQGRFCSSPCKMWARLGYEYQQLGARSGWAPPKLGGKGPQDLPLSLNWI